MATTTQLYAVLNGGACEVSYTFDDTTLLIESITATNNGASGTVFASIWSADGTQLIWGPESVKVGAGQTVWDVSGAGYHVTLKTNPKNGQQVYSLPVTLQVAWTASVAE